MAALLAAGSAGAQPAASGRAPHRGRVALPPIEAILDHLARADAPAAATGRALVPGGG